MSCLICGEMVSILNGPEYWIWYSGGIAHRSCYDELMSLGNEVLNEAII